MQVLILLQGMFRYLLSMYREKLSYAYSSEIQNLSEKYTVFSNSDIEQRNIYDFVLSRLQQYGRCEQF